ncbi:MAG: hypothetical protein K1X89_26630 [Myxococcaceae bacterium]|nr:hypothetical protein [Myxococcaceae bacterium]
MDRSARLVVAALSLSLSACAPLPRVAFHDGALLHLVDDVHLDPAAPRADRERLVALLGEAKAHLQGTFGRLRGYPVRVIVCATDDCRRFFAGPRMRSMLIAPGDRMPGEHDTRGQLTVVLVDAGERALNHLAHELVHVELLSRLGPEAAARIPAWFHEGVAASLSDEPPCPAALVDDPLVESLRTPRAWWDRTNEPGQGVATYCAARARAEAWGVAHHGKQGLLALLDAVKSGEPFPAAFGAPEPAR